MNLDIKVTGEQRIKAMIGLLKVTPQKRKNILRKVARKAKTINAKRRREQIDIDGKSFKSRNKVSASVATHGNKPRCKVIFYKKCRLSGICAPTRYW
jgi:DUF4097 and DUF4098 domain-containing protein YvlB